MLCYPRSKRAPTQPTSPSLSRPSQRKLTILHMHAHLSSLGVSLQVMHGTWLSWDVYQVIAYLKPSLATRDSSQSFGLQLVSQVFSISYRPNRSIEATADTRVKLELPTLSITGRSSESCFYTLACIEFFVLIVKPSHWDTLLTVQQKFGQDFNDLINLVEETRRKNSSPSPKKPFVIPTSLKYSGFLKLRGFRIGLRGISSTLFLECDDIGGGIDNDSGSTWNVRLSDLALSLAPRGNSTTRESSFNRNHRSAFVIIDFEAKTGRHNGKEKTLQISVTKIHAVMRPSSIGEVGDFVDHLQVL